jgi:hypothetical protein
LIPRFVVCSSTPANAAFFVEQPEISPTKTLSACKRYTRASPFANS